MKTVNKVTLLGNVTRDAEVQETTGGQKICSFGLATTRVWKDANGETQSEPEYHNITALNGLAEFCGQYVKKGKRLYIEGYLKTHGWETATGIKRDRTEITIDNIVLLGAKAPDCQLAVRPACVGRRGFFFARRGRQNCHRTRARWLRLQITPSMSAAEAASSAAIRRARSFPSARQRHTGSPEWNPCFFLRKMRG